MCGFVLFSINSYLMPTSLQTGSVAFSQKVPLQIFDEILRPCRIGSAVRALIIYVLWYLPQSCHSLSYSDFLIFSNSLHFLRSLEALFIICPIAIAYSMGQIIKSVYVCQSVCPSANTLTVAFLDRFSPKLVQT